MRRTFLILSLTGLTLLAGASDAFAQYGLFGLRSRPLVTVDLGDGGYYSPFGYYGGPGYGPNYRGYRYAPSYFDGTPGYPYYPAPAPLAPATQIRRSYYPAPEAVQEHVGLTVLVPTADAQVWFDGAATKQQGMERVFHSPNLEPNHNFTYTIKARWIENGKAINRERQVHFQAGHNVTVNFRENAGENVPSPSSGKPIPLPQK